MRRKFAAELYNLMFADSNIFLIVGDMGFGLLDRIKKEFPMRFINVGAAEQTMIDVAVGLTLEHKIAVVYTITPFLLFRPFEQIRNYVDHESIPVVLVGSGRDKDYSDAGFSHDASDHDIIKAFRNIKFIEDEDFNLSEIIYSRVPTYLNLKR
jgi:transketolase